MQGKQDQLTSIKKTTETNIDNQIENVENLETSYIDCYDNCAVTRDVVHFLVDVVNLEIVHQDKIPKTYLQGKIAVAKIIERLKSSGKII